MNYALERVYIDNWALVHREFASRMHSAIGSRNSTITREYHEAADNLEWIKLGRGKVMALLESINSQIINMANQVEAAQSESLRGGDKNSLSRQIATLESDGILYRNVAIQVENQLNALSRDIALYEQKLEEIFKYLSYVGMLNNRIAELIARDNVEIDKLYEIDSRFRNIKV